MPFRAITRVPAKSVSRRKRVEGAHETVSRHFRQDGRRRDGKAQRVAADDRLGPARKMLGHVAPVDEGVVRRQIQRAKSAVHARESRSANVDGVDLVHADKHNGDRAGGRQNIGE